MSASPALSSTADADVARRIAEGSPDAASHEEELCRRYLNRARLYGLRHLRFDVTAAEDLAQQVMMVVLESLRAGRVQDLERIDRYMLGTCRNVAHTMRRAHRRVEEVSRRLTDEPPVPVDAPWERFASRRVEECLARLPARDCRLLLLLFQEERSAAEAARELGTTAGNVRVMRHRAIGRLRECVGAGGGTAQP